VEALLVDQPPDQQDEAFIGGGVPGPQAVEVRHHRVEVARVDAVLDHRDARRPDAEHVRDVAAHVPRAGDDMVGPADHRALETMDVGLRVVLDPPLVPSKLRRVNRKRGLRHAMDDHAVAHRRVLPGNQ
jgi:hypothetical protein